MWLVEENTNHGVNSGSADTISKRSKGIGTYVYKLLPKMPNLVIL